MGNRIAKGAAEEDYFDWRAAKDGDVPYRPANVKVCASEAQKVNTACAADEVWWEETPLQITQKYEICFDRNNYYGGAGPDGIPHRYHTCSKVAAADCPVLAGGVAATRAVPINPGAFDGHGVRCFYNVRELGKSCEASTEFTMRRKEGDDSLQLNDEWFSPDVMNTLCDQRADPKTCPKHPIGKVPTDSEGSVCSQITACRLCKDWALSGWPESAKQSDTMMKTWCDAHHDDPSCGCIRRSYDPLFLELTSIPGLVLPSKAGCWWKNCADKQIEYDLIQSEDRSYKDCPTDVCINIWNQTGGIADIGTLNMNITCGARPDDDGSTCIPSCGEHGRCASGRCICDDGYTGVSCQTKKEEEDDDDTCTPSCGENGRCDGGSCVCDDGWTGASCQTKKEDDKKRTAIIVAGALAAAALSIGFVAVALKKSKSK